MHVASTRNLDDNEWEELRKFKKCLLRMYAEEGKDVIFIETAMGLAQKRPQCSVECIPLPNDIAKEAPLYFKKAIDEAESEWSQHNAKKLIDTSINGLGGSIPNFFPYFHVEFGMQKGFVHVIDDEKTFKGQFGLNVIRGMLQLREEDMYMHRQRDSLQMQHKAVSNFGRKWEPYDWTKMLDKGLDMRDFWNTPNGPVKAGLAVNGRIDAEPPPTPLGGRTDVFDLPFHMARDQIEQSLRTKMASIKERMLQLQEAKKGAQVTCEASEHELELEAQLVEARSIIQEQNMPVIKSRACLKSSISFCVAVIIETLGAVTTVDTNLVNKFLPFILYCFDLWL